MAEGPGEAGQTPDTDAAVLLEATTAGMSNEELGYVPVDTALFPPTRPTLRFVVLGQAQSAGSKRAFKNPRTGGIIVTDDNPKSKNWQQQVKVVAIEALTERGLTPPWIPDGPVAVTFVFFRERPKGHYGKRGLLPSAPARPTTRPDVLKLARGVEDALTGIVWRDDAQIVDERLVKRFGDPARVDLEVVGL